MGRVMREMRPRGGGMGRERKKREGQEVRIGGIRVVKGKEGSKIRRRTGDNTSTSLMDSP